MRRSTLPLAFALLALPSFAQQSWSDDFNRPDASSLGADWVYVLGVMKIQNQRAVDNNYFTSYFEHASAHLPYTQAVESMDFFSGGISVIAAIGSTTYGDCIEAYIVDSGLDGTFDVAYFRDGPSTGHSDWGYNQPFYLPQPLTSGRLELYVTNNGDTANLDIDGDFDGVFETHFSLGGIHSFGTNPGTGVAIGGNYYGCGIDNWMCEQRASEVTTYCTAKVNSQGCTPTIYATGIPRATGNASFMIHANHVLNQKPGLLLYSTAGRAAMPFQSGLLCLAGPIKRSIPLSSGGSALPQADCTGVYALDMTAFARGLIGGSPSPLLSNPGQVVDVQYWGRDPGFVAPDNSTLSDALEYTVQ
jgi:hypothetical protein